MGFTLVEVLEITHIHTPHTDCYRKLPPRWLDFEHFGFFPLYFNALFEYFTVSWCPFIKITNFLKESQWRRKGTKKEEEGRGILSCVRMALLLSHIDHKTNRAICSSGSTGPLSSRPAWFLVMAFNPHLEGPSQVPGYPDSASGFPNSGYRNLS